MTIHKRFVSAAFARAGLGLTTVVAIAAMLLPASGPAMAQQDGKDAAAPPAPETEWALFSRLRDGRCGSARAPAEAA